MFDRPNKLLVSFHGTNLTVLRAGLHAFEKHTQLKTTWILEFPAAWVEKHFERIGGWILVPQELLAQWQQMRSADAAAVGKPKPLCYSFRRQRRKFNAQLSFLGEPADIILHPDTAAVRGIVNGQNVRVFN